MLVEGLDRAGAFVFALVKDAAAPEGVVGGDEAPLAQPWQHSLVVTDVVRLVGVNEDEVEFALEPADRLQRRAEVDLDLVGVSALVDVAAGDGGSTRI